MNVEETSRRSVRARQATTYRALGDERRLAIVETLWHSDRPVGEIAARTGLASNLLAFHLQVLEDAGVIVRAASQGDGRRRYVSLTPGVVGLLDPPPALGSPAERVLFVCTANSARSQLAAHLWRSRTGHPALSAGTEPAARVHPRAVATGRRHGLDLAGARPAAVADLDARADLVVSVCDRAYEQGFEVAGPRLHWSLPDPVPAGAATFDDVFARLADRVDRLAAATEAE